MLKIHSEFQLKNHKNITVKIPSAQILNLIHFMCEKFQHYSLEERKDAENENSRQIDLKTMIAQVLTLAELKTLTNIIQFSQMTRCAYVPMPLWQEEEEGSYHRCPRRHRRPLCPPVLCG